MGEYRNIVNAKQWEPTDINEKSQDEHFPLEISTEEIEDPLIKTVNKYDFKNRHNGNDKDSGG